MKKKVCLLVTLIVSLFIWCDRVEAAKELTCVYKSGNLSYVTMLVQDSKGNSYYYVTHMITAAKITDVDKVDWKQTTDYSDDTVKFYYNSDELGELSSCPKYTSGYNGSETEVNFYDKKGITTFDYQLVDKLSGEGIPYVVSGESDKRNEIVDINDAEWSSKCVYCGLESDGNTSCLDLYFNDKDILIDNHRNNIISEIASFTITAIKDSYGFACPDRIYETYFDSYSTYEIPAVTFSAQYHLSNPKTFGVIYNSPQPVFNGGEITGYQTNYLYELRLDKEKSYDEFEYTGEFGSAFTDKDIDNCEDLFSDKLIEMINGVLNIVRIAVPILLIVLGILDFAKATFSGKEDDMVKNRKRFINRIIAAVIVFLVPIFVNLLLTLANEVWGYINPTSCIK